MVFKMHSAFALGLIALVAGTYLITKMPSADQCCNKFAKFIGWFVIITAVLGLICTTYQGVSYWKEGGYKHGKMWRGKGMKGKCPMMEMMKEHPEKPVTTE